jgi:hypothetical protein
LPVSTPAPASNCFRRATSACDESASFAVRRTSFVSSSASLSRRRQDLKRDFYEPESVRAATSAQRSSSQRVSTASARAPVPARKGIDNRAAYPQVAAWGRPNPAALGQRPVYGELIVENRHVLDDIIASAALPAGTPAPRRLCRGSKRRLVSCEVIRGNNQKSHVYKSET